jgi:hypothetical protein
VILRALGIAEPRLVEVFDAARPAGAGRPAQASCRTAAAAGTGADPSASIRAIAASSGMP